MKKSGLKENAVVLFMGDSITDGGRSYSDMSSLGSNHPKLFNDYMQAHFQEDHISVFNTGVAGDTLLNLYFRLEEDCYALNPDYIVLLIGVNDAWNGYAGKDVFDNTYRLILDGILANTGAKLILIEPFLLEASQEMQVNCVIPNVNSYLLYVVEMVEIVRQLAVVYGLELICMAGILQRLIITGTQPVRLAADAIHPTPEAVTILLDQILTKLAVNGYAPMAYPFDEPVLVAEYCTNESATPVTINHKRSFYKPTAVTKYCAVGSVDSIARTARILLDTGDIELARYDGAAPAAGFVSAYRRLGDSYRFETIQYDTSGMEQASKRNIVVNARQKQLVCKDICFVDKDTVFFIRFSRTEWRVLRGRGVLPCENYNIDLMETAGYIVSHMALDGLARLARCVVIVGSCASDGEWPPADAETTRVFIGNHIGFAHGDKDLS